MNKPCPTTAAERLAFYKERLRTDKRDGAPEYVINNWHRLIMQAETECCLSTDEQ